MKSDKTIKDKILLYDANGNQDFILYNLDSGYIIVSKINNDISEFSLESSNKYFTKNGKRYIYGGPLEYYEENDKKLIDLKTNKEEKETKKLKERLTKSKNKYLSYTEDKKIMNSKASTAPATLYETRIAGQLPNYDYNPNGVCGSCAVGNLLKFYSLNVKSEFVPKKYSDVAPEKPGVRLIKSIIPYIEGSASVDPSFNSPGSSPDKLKSGLQNYLIKEVGYTGSVAIGKSTLGPSITNTGRPYILGLYKDGSAATTDNFYGNHWVVGVSYVYMKDLQQLPIYYGVIDGWGNNNVYVKVTWTDYAVWI